MAGTENCLGLVSSRSIPGVASDLATSGRQQANRFVMGGVDRLPGRPARLRALPKIFKWTTCMNAPTPFISIIIPTHNRSGSVRRTLKSLCCQDYPANLFEVIVSADGCL